MDLRHALPRTPGAATLIALILQIPLLLASAPSLALGLGNASLKTALGYPLAVEIPILDRSASLGVEQVRVHQVLGLDAEQMGYDLAASAQPLLISVYEQSGGLTIQVKSAAPVYEPLVSFVLELSWPGGTLYRDYSLLLDLPPAAPRNPPATEARTTSPEAQPAVMARPSHTGKQWRVEPGQSLWRIARRIQPDPRIPLDTVMAAIHERNPHAFLNGDMNRLQAGALLNLPGAADYSAPPASASRPATAASALAGQEPLPPTADTASPTAQTEQARRGRLRLSGSPTATSGGHTVRLSEEIDAMKEQLDKVNRENAQLRQQIQRIKASEYLAVMQEMLQLQEQRITQLKAQLRTDAVDMDDAGSAGTTPGGISTPASPAPAVVREPAPSYAALLLLILAGIAGGVVLSQVPAWIQKRRMAISRWPEDRAVRFNTLTTHWRGEFPPPAPEPYVTGAEESGMEPVADQEEGQESAGGTATAGPEHLFGKLRLDGSFGGDSAKRSAQSSPPSEGVMAPDFATYDELPLDEVAPPAAEPASGAMQSEATESGDAGVRSSTSKESGMEAAGGGEESLENAASPARPSPESLFEDLQLDESFGQDLANSSPHSGLPGGEDLVLDFVAFDQLAVGEIDTAAAEPEPAAESDVGESGDINLTSASSRAGT
ncbi:type IV pilus assembly protein FimV [Microbulbifer yueqingensis]|uniref:FimV N-terminal domain-containing protein n=1 Tax=Microbulbifer yueqingensis TaxID=658219 RepID=A0A1G8UY86_9GAMM|nr:FimV/HubP family polar landmark protein [Microbulbifer yueqingensis]SDJ58771.1 FimV N-terminal domain-containing protein [Microbulbifer yueqingensis]